MTATCDAPRCGGADADADPFAPWRNFWSFLSLIDIITLNRHHMHPEVRGGMGE